MEESVADRRPMLVRHILPVWCIAAALAAAAVAPASSQEPLLASGTPLDLGIASRRVVLMDVDRDRQVDLVTLLRDNTIAVLFGDGAGIFEGSVATPLELDPGTVVLDDVTADGDIDAVVAWRDEKSEYVGVWPGASGRFTAPAQPPMRLGPARQYYKPFVRVLDLNRDGARDLVAGNERGPGFQVLLGTGRGRFAPPVTIAYEPAGAAYYSLNVADVDRDQRPDLVIAASAAGSGASRLVVMFGNGGGGFAGRVDVPLSVAPDPRIAAIGDLNDDAAPDLVLSHPEQRTLDVLFNTGGRRFTPAPWSPLRARLPATAVTIADVTGDTRPDLVALTVDSVNPRLESEVAVLVSHAKGFSLANGSPFPVGAGAFSLASGDVNGDEKLDFVTSSFTSERITILMAR